jgi:DNA-binding MarR family transcriptional regulator
MPTSTAEQAAIDLMQAAGQLVRRTRAESHADELSLTEAVVISRLSKDGAATTADLARAEHMKPQSMGTTVAALESMELVQRRPHPTDGRQVLIELTEKGTLLRKRTGEAKRMWLSQALAALSREDQEALSRATGIIRKLTAE